MVSDSTNSQGSGAAIETPVDPRIEFFEGVAEAIDDVRLRQNQRTGCRNVLMVFTTLRCIEQFRALRAEFNKGLRLQDEEGTIQVEPSNVRFVFGGPEGDDFVRLECDFDIDREEVWERFMRFMHRYAAANGLGYSDKGAPAEG